MIERRETHRHAPVSAQWSHARTSDDFSIFQTGCSTEDNRLSIYNRIENNANTFQLKQLSKHLAELENNSIKLKYIC